MRVGKVHLNDILALTVQEQIAVTELRPGSDKPMDIAKIQVVAKRT